MKKAPIVIISLVIVAALAGLIIYFLNRQQTSTVPETMPTMNQPSPGQSQSAPATTETEVNIRNFAFTPSNLSVKKGTTVKWTNSDDTAHTITESDSKTGPSSLLLTKNQTYTFTFNEVGAFAYKCSVHPSMTATITVTE